MGNYFSNNKEHMAASTTATTNSGDTFACSMDGYVGMVEEIISLLLAVITMVMSTLEAALPDNLAKSIKYAYRFLRSSGSWMGFLVAGVYFISIDAGFGDTLCEMSAYGYVPSTTSTTLLPSVRATE